MTASERTREARSGETRNSYTVANNVFGFGIYEGGEPVLHNGGLVTFHGRIWAEQYAASLSNGDRDTSKAIFRQHGKVYTGIAKWSGIA